MVGHNSVMQVIHKNVGIVGTGAMGRGIAQIAAQAGSLVKLMDAQAGAAEKAREAICAQWDKRVEKGRLATDLATAYKSRLLLARTLADLADCDLVIEAIVERLDVKQTLFAELETLVPAHTVLVSNTSSLSVTAIAAALKHPERFAGYHFFNPVPLMKVVEVIAGLKTGAAVCSALADYARQLGHTPVHAQDTPGFIVNHAGRGYGTEALRIVGEGIADFATIDRILRDQAGFKLGPFELMDLTGLDVSHPVMESIYHQYYEEDRYRPSVITAQRLARKLCETCKAPADYPREAMLRAGYTATELDGGWKPYRAVGCSACNNGYKGRVGIYQVMPITEAIQRIILSEGTALDIADQARKEGIRDLRQSGLVKVRAGLTTLEEVISVTNE